MYHNNNEMVNLVKKVNEGGKLYPGINAPVEVAGKNHPEALTKPTVIIPMGQRSNDEQQLSEGFGSVVGNILLSGFIFQGVSKLFNIVERFLRKDEFTKSDIRQAKILKTGVIKKISDIEIQLSKNDSDKEEKLKLEKLKGLLSARVKELDKRIKESEKDLGLKESTMSDLQKELEYVMENRDNPELINEIEEILSEAGLPPSSTQNDDTRGPSGQNPIKKLIQKTKRSGKAGPIKSPSKGGPAPTGAPPVAPPPPPPAAPPVPPPAQEIPAPPQQGAPPVPPTEPPPASRFKEGFNFFNISEGKKDTPEIDNKGDGGDFIDNKLAGEGNMKSAYSKFKKRKENGKSMIEGSIDTPTDSANKPEMFLNACTVNPIRNKK